MKTHPQWTAEGLMSGEVALVQRYATLFLCTGCPVEKDSEIMLPLGCTEEEKDIAMRFHNGSE